MRIEKIIKNHGKHGLSKMIELISTESRRLLMDGYNGNITDKMYKPFYTILEQSLVTKRFPKG